MAPLIDMDDAATMTVLLLCIVLALIVALIRLFYVLEQSPRIMRARQVMSRLVDSRMNVSQMRRDRDK